MDSKQVMILLGTAFGASTLAGCAYPPGGTAPIGFPQYGGGQQRDRSNGPFNCFDRQRAWNSHGQPCGTNNYSDSYGPMAGQVNPRTGYQNNQVSQSPVQSLLRRFGF